MRLLKSKILVISLTLIILICARHIYCSLCTFYVPDYPRRSISGILYKDNQSSEDMSVIFKQTGASPFAAKELINGGNTKILAELNKLYFTRPVINKEYIFFPFTAQESTNAQITPLVPLKDGDILITFNTHTCDWRHGHAAIVTDSRHDEILEHRSIGCVSTLGKASLWGNYPAFAVLRYTDESISGDAARYAREHLLGLDYNILAGVLKKDKTDDISGASSHCSHIVWQAYKAFGVDIDSNGGVFVTPHDIAMSDKLKVVQIFGMKQSDFTGRILK